MSSYITLKALTHRRVIAGLALAAGTPFLVLADAQGGLTPFTNTLNDILNILNQAVIPIIIALATIYFLWGVVSYVIAKGPEEKERAKDTMIYGLIGLFVIFAVWGLLVLLGDLLGVDEQQGALDFNPSTPAP